MAKPNTIKSISLKTVWERDAGLRTVGAIIEGHDDNILERRHAGQVSDIVSASKAAARNEY